MADQFEGNRAQPSLGPSPWMGPSTEPAIAPNPQGSNAPSAFPAFIPFAASSQSAIRSDMMQVLCMPAAMEEPFLKADQRLPGPAAAGLPLDTLPQNTTVVERRRFLIFMKILFQMLKNAESEETRRHAQRIVVECRFRSQTGDPAFCPLERAVDKHLRAFLGEALWNKARLLLHLYLKREEGVIPSPPRRLAIVQL